MEAAKKLQSSLKRARNPLKNEHTRKLLTRLFSHSKHHSRGFLSFLIKSQLLRVLRRFECCFGWAGSGGFGLGVGGLGGFWGWVFRKSIGAIKIKILMAPLLLFLGFGWGF